MWFSSGKSWAVVVVLYARALWSDYVRFRVTKEYKYDENTVGKCIVNTKNGVLVFVYLLSDDASSVVTRVGQLRSWIICDFLLETFMS